LVYQFFWGDFCDWYIELVETGSLQNGIFSAGGTDVGVEEFCSGI